jgi:Fibronectin type III domain/Carbohydrate binding domain
MSVLVTCSNARVPKRCHWMMHPGRRVNRCRQDGSRLLQLVSTFALLACLLVVVNAAPVAAVGEYKLPWAGGASWNVTQGLHTTRAWDFQPPGAGSHNDVVLAVAAGTARITCTDSVGQAMVDLTTPAGTFRYLHLQTSAVQAAGIGTTQAPVLQGQELGRLHPSPPDSDHGCGYAMPAGASHLHLQFPSLPFTLDGMTFSDAGPNGGSLTSSNQSAPVDTDSDGIPDGSDRCPSLRGFSQWRGCRPDLLRNASFEEGNFSGWATTGPGTTNAGAYASGAARRDGDWLASMNVSQASGSVYQDVGVAPRVGESYTFSMWVRKSEPGVATGRLYLWGVGGSQNLNVSEGFAVGTDWTLLSVTYDVRLNHDFLRAQLYLDTTNQSILLDGASLAPGSRRLTPPGPPLNPVASSADGAIDLSWVVPAVSGGSRPTKYLVTASPSGSTRSTSTPSVRFDGLTNGQPYTFTVAAINAVGKGAPAFSASQTPAAPPPSAVVPAAPRSLSSVAGDGSVLVSWVAPVSDGGSTVSGYRVTQSPGGVVRMVSGLSSVFTGLTNGTAYTFKVAALNAVGAGSEVSVSATPLGSLPPVVLAVAFGPLVPGRLLDSRSGSATVDGQFAGIGQRAAGSVTELQVTGRHGVPVDASAVVLNVTVTDPKAAGYVTVWPCGSPQPNASNLNFDTGVTIPNAVITKIGAGGKVCLFTTAATHLITDINGYQPV